MTLHSLHADVGMPAWFSGSCQQESAWLSTEITDWKTQYFKDKLATASSARESLECW